jgi:hypothetical protein
MDRKNLVLAGLIGAVINLVLCNTPVIQMVNILLCAGFWIGAVVAVWFFKSRTGSVTLQQGVFIGVCAGLIAWVIGFALSFFGLAGISRVLGQAGSIFSSDVTSQMDQAIASVGEIVMNICGIFIDVGFGALGGLIGGFIFKNR